MAYSAAHIADLTASPFAASETAIDPLATTFVRESPAPYGGQSGAEPESDRSDGSATGGVPDPFKDGDALDEIEDKVIRLAAHIHAAEHRLLVLILEFDKGRGWDLGGHRNCTDWLHAVTGLDRGAAGQRVRAARALEELPQVSDAMSKGSLSFSKVRALSRLREDLNEESERVLVDYAKKVSAADLEKVVRSWGELNRVDEAELERIRHRKRTFSVFPGDDGMYVVRGVVDAEVGALLMRGIEAASDALYKSGLSWSAEGGAYGLKTEEVTPEQRRADALGLLTERAMVAGFGIQVDDERDAEEEEEDVGNAAADEAPKATKFGEQRTSLGRSDAGEEPQADTDDHEECAVREATKADTEQERGVAAGGGDWRVTGEARENGAATHGDSFADVHAPYNDNPGRHGSEPSVPEGLRGSAEPGREVPSGSARSSDSAVTGGKPVGGGRTGSAETDRPGTSTSAAHRSGSVVGDSSPVGGGHTGSAGTDGPGASASTSCATESAAGDTKPPRGGQTGSAESGRSAASASAARADKPATYHRKPVGGDASGRASVPLSGTRAERYMVVVHVSPSTLKKDGEIGRSNLQDGIRLSAETSRRLSCDCSLVQVTRGEQGEVLNVGRKRRTIPPALRRALEIRDGGCRFPGCGARICDSHHIIHWEDGGETCLDNLCLLCRIHHRAVHEEGFSIRMLSDGTLRFLDRVGWPLPDFAPPPELEEDPVEALIRQNQARGVDPDGSACSSRYERSADIPWSLEAGVWEALDPS